MSSAMLLRRFRAQACLTGLLLWGLAGCQTSPPPKAPTLPVPEPESELASAGTHDIIAGESLLQVFVYRGGPLARLGHNHVIASDDLAGTVHWVAGGVGSRFLLSIPVNSLTVDEPQLRERAGADFPPQVPASAREGTRRNLLSAALLDGEKHPWIRVRGTEVRRVAEGYEVDVEITVKDQRHQRRVPVRLEPGSPALRAHAEFTLKQTDLGLQPFSAAMGSLLVLDEMRVSIDITARESAAAPVR